MALATSIKPSGEEGLNSLSIEYFNSLWEDLKNFSPTGEVRSLFPEGFFESYIFGNPVVAEFITKKLEEHNPAGILFAQIARNLIRFLPENFVAINLGSGFGVDSRRLSGLVGGRCLIVDLEKVPYISAQNNSLNVKGGIMNILAVTGDLKRLPFSRKKPPFDLAFSSGTLRYVSPHNLQESLEVLKNEGYQVLLEVGIAGKNNLNPNGGSYIEFLNNNGYVEAPENWAESGLEPGQYIALSWDVAGVPLLTRFYTLIALLNPGVTIPNSIEGLTPPEIDELLRSLNINNSIIATMDEKRHLLNKIISLRECVLSNYSCRPELDFTPELLEILYDLAGSSVKTVYAVIVKKKQNK